jgi:hypothetical protein
VIENTIETGGSYFYSEREMWELGDKLQRAGRVDYGCKVSNERTCCKHEVL